VASTIPNSFATFKSRLEITSLQQSTVSTRQAAVRNAIATHLTVKDSFVTGSYRRHTMIAPLSEADVDILVVLAPEYYSVDGWASLLDRVRSALLKTYTRTPKISRNGQAVTITFSDFVVDVVPGFWRKGGGYLIPSTTEQSWIPTNPKVHETFMSRANAAHNGHLVPLIKMIKAWNRAVGRPFRSFYLELLTEQILRGVRISDYPSGCRYVFDKGREKIKYTIADPSGLGSHEISGLVSGTVGQAVTRFQAAYDRAITAERQARDGRVSAAVTEWQKVFGDTFPSYEGPQ
jgi:hypothetical protein